MNETNHTPKSCVRRINRDVARIVFELETPFHDDPITPEILRKGSDVGNTTIEHEGFTLTGITKNWVAFVHVRRGDVVMVRWKTSSGEVIATSRFEITNTFAPRLMEPVQMNAPFAIFPSRPLIEAGDGCLLHIQESAMKRIFTDRHPTWIQSPLNEAIKQWRSENPKLFLRIAPPAEIQREIPLLVRFDPGRALAEYSGALDAEQFRICMERNPEAAARHAFKRIPRADRIGLVRTYSTLVLSHHLDRMTEMELEVASGADAMTAFHLRHFLEGRRHAILLSKSYPAAFFSDRHGAKSELDREVKQSVLEFPRIWHRTHYRSFRVLFRGLECTLGIQFSGDEILQLLEKLGPKLRHELRVHVGSQI
jgi:hypothetical protein